MHAQGLLRHEMGSVALVHLVFTDREELEVLYSAEVWTGM